MMKTTTPQKPGSRVVLEPEVVDPREDVDLQLLRKLTQLLDDQFEIPGTGVRFGWDSIIGLVPGIGDVATTVLSLYLFSLAKKYGLSRWQRLRMLANIGVDATVGIIPFLGDAFDVAFKANRKNLRILEKHLEKNRQRKPPPQS